MAEVIFVNDTREEGDSTLDVYPRMTTFEQVVDTFHVEVNRSYGWDTAPGGAQVFKLVGFQVRTGSPSFLATVLNTDGSPRPNVLINAHYPDFQADPEWEPQPPYHPRAFGDYTNSTGVWGLPVGHLYTTPDGGPVTLWPDVPHDGIKPPQYSDATFGIGYLGGTAYLAPHPIWQVLVKEGGTTPTGTEYLVHVSGGVVVAHIALVPGAPGAGTDALGLWRGGEIVSHALWTAGAP